jgi:hypothetical protein
VPDDHPFTQNTFTLVGVNHYLAVPANSLFGPLEDLATLPTNLENIAGKLRVVLKYQHWLINKNRPI